MLGLIAIAFIIFIVLYIQHEVQRKYIDFVNQNSISLKKILEINQRYVFYPYIDLNQTHTYDNEKFYDNISCSDYLIYQLQYLSPKIFEQVKKVDSNKQKYQEYLCEVQTIQFGQFQCPVGKLKLDKLLDTEKNIVNKAVQTPVRGNRRGIPVCALDTGTISDHFGCAIRFGWSVRHLCGIQLGLPL